MRELPIAKTNHPRLYQSERWFEAADGERPGYEIPLPPGTYKVTLHFAEVWFHYPGARRFDVFLEGERVIEDYDPFQAGFATADKHIFQVAVNDGALNVGFVRRTGDPKLSSLEIETGE